MSKKPDLEAWDEEEEDEEYDDTPAAWGTDVEKKGFCARCVQYKYFKIDCTMLIMIAISLGALAFLGLNVASSQTAVDGGWSDWSTWSPCSATCGTGLHGRNRTCSNPATVNGKPCVGDYSERQLCVFAECPAGEWSAWEAWGACSVTCGSGFQRRSRTCSNPSQDLQLRPCVGDYSDFQVCAITPC